MYSQKKYALAHVGGMTREAEFEAVKRLLESKRLIDPEGDRTVFLRPRRDGGFEERRYLYLWDRRDAAEAVAKELNDTEPKRRWRVDELDGIAVAELLEPGRLRDDFDLPDRPKVLGITAELIDGPSDDDSLRVWVVLDDDTTEQERTWAGIEPIKKAIHNALVAHDVPLWPLVRFRTESEFALQNRSPR